MRRKMGFTDDAPAQDDDAPRKKLILPSEPQFKFGNQAKLPEIPAFTGFGQNKKRVQIVEEPTEPTPHNNNGPILRKS